MTPSRITLAICASTLAIGCIHHTDDTQEIIDNLIEVGYPASEIIVENDVVYAGRDAVVTLAASREMREAADGKEQYRTNNLVSRSLSKICINAVGYTGVFSTALDLAIQNYDELPLTFAMARAPSSGCSFTINANIEPGFPGGLSGFPSGGLPFGNITVFDEMIFFNVNTIAHLITHEIGHTIGMRHSDFFNWSISCGATGGEGDAGVGAVHIPGTPTGAVRGGSVMNTCFQSVETGDFIGADVTAVLALYGI